MSVRLRTEVQGLSRATLADARQAGEIPIVPGLTTWVLTESGEDERLFKEFTALAGQNHYFLNTRHPDR